MFVLETMPNERLGSSSDRWNIKGDNIVSFFFFFFKLNRTRNIPSFTLNCYAATKTISLNWYSRLNTGCYYYMFIYDASTTKIFAIIVSVNEISKPKNFSPRKKSENVIKDSVNVRFLPL